MKNFRALDNHTIFSDISKIRVLIHITLCRNAKIQMDISRSNRFSADEAINYIPSTEKRKKVPVREMLEYSVIWGFLLPYTSSFIMGTEDNSIQRQLMIPLWSKLELLCRYEIAPWHYIVTRSSIVDDLRVWDPSLFLCKTLPKRLKFNQVDIYMFKVKKKGTKLKCEICATLTIKAPKWG